MIYFWCFSFEFTLCVFWIKLWRKMIIRVLVEQFNYFLDESPVVKTLQFLLSWDFLLDMRLIWALKEARGGGGREASESSQVILNRIRTTVCLLSLPLCVTEHSPLFPLWNMPIQIGTYHLSWQVEHHQW